MALDPKVLNESGQTWQNLGDWSQADSYGEAASALARRLGVALALSPEDRVIDVGCGSGDQLCVWREVFNVARVHGLEPSTANARRAQRRCVRDDAIFVSKASDRAVGSTTDASVVLSLDAAYHFSSRAEFLRRAAAALPAGGRLGLADLVAPGARPDLRARMFALGAGIPQQNLWSTERWAAELAQAGFRPRLIEDLTQPVLAGFGAFVARRWPEIIRRFGMTAFAVIATGWAARSAAQRGWLSFALVVAEREASSASIGKKS